MINDDHDDDTAGDDTGDDAGDGPDDYDDNVGGDQDDSGGYQECAHHRHIWWHITDE